MTIRTAEPLPECLLCEAPTRRSVFDTNGGLCSACDAGIAAAARLLPPRNVVDLDTRRAGR